MGTAPVTRTLRDTVLMVAQGIAWTDDSERFDREGKRQFRNEMDFTGRTAEQAAL
jgi:hypothetical protein